MSCTGAGAGFLDGFEGPGNEGVVDFDVVPFVTDGVGVEDGVDLADFGAASVPRVGERECDDRVSSVWLAFGGVSTSMVGEGKNEAVKGSVAADVTEPGSSCLSSRAALVRRSDLTGESMPMILRIGTRKRKKRKQCQLQRQRVVRARKNFNAQQADDVKQCWGRTR